MSCAPNRLLLTVCSVLAFIANADSTHVTVAFQEHTSNEATLLTSLSSVSSVSSINKLHCSSLCSKRPDCLTFRFSPDTATCHMSNEEPGGFGSSVVAFHSDMRKRPDLQVCKRLVATSDGRLSCIIQQRVSGAVDFQQSWSVYENGFGDDVNFWLGLHNIHLLSSPMGKPLLVEIVTWSDQKMYQEYSSFHVRNASTKFMLTVGNVIVSKSNLYYNLLASNNGKFFSTMDSDNDPWTASCSTVYHGNAGWWFAQCSSVNPNGIYVGSAQVDSMYMTWMYNASWMALKAVRLMLIV